MLTIDRCELSKSPTINEYEIVLNELNKNEIFDIEGSFFEYKIKLNSKWIHLHAIISSKIYLKYSDFRVQNYSIKLEFLRTQKDLNNAWRYITKYVTDQVHNDPEHQFAELIFLEEE